MRKLIQPLDPSLLRQFEVAVMYDWRRWVRRQLPRISSHEISIAEVHRGCQYDPNETPYEVFDTCPNPAASESNATARITCKPPRLWNVVSQIVARYGSPRMNRCINPQYEYDRPGPVTAHHFATAFLGGIEREEPLFAYYLHYAKKFSPLTLARGICWAPTPERVILLMNEMARFIADGTYKGMESHYYGIARSCIYVAFLRRNYDLIRLYASSEFWAPMNLNQSQIDDLCHREAMHYGIVEFIPPPPWNESVVIELWGSHHIVCILRHFWPEPCEIPSWMLAPINSLGYAGAIITVAFAGYRIPDALWTKIVSEYFRHVEAFSHEPQKLAGLSRLAEDLREVLPAHLIHLVHLLDQGNVNV